jgi:hypothetical protein
LIPGLSEDSPLFKGTPRAVPDRNIQLTDPPHVGMNRKAIKAPGWNNSVLVDIRMGVGHSCNKSLGNKILLHYKPLVSSAQLVELIEDGKMPATNNYYISIQSEQNHSASR